MSNNNREQDDEGKERGEEKARCGVDMRECTMDNDCPASKKGRCFLCLGPAGRLSVSCHCNKMNLIVLQYAAALASPGQKGKTKAMSAHSTSIYLGRCVINLENVKRWTCCCNFGNKVPSV
jgi:hypothetical protein